MSISDYNDNLLGKQKRFLKECYLRVPIIVLIKNFPGRQNKEKNIYIYMEIIDKSIESWQVFNHC